MDLDRSWKGALAAYVFLQEVIEVDGVPDLSLDGPAGKSF